MTDALKLGFSSFATPTKGVLVVFCDDGLNFGAATKKAIGSAVDVVTRVAKAERFTGKKNSTLDLTVPPGLEVSRLAVIGLGKIAELKPNDFLRLGGLAIGRLPNATSDATVFAEIPGGAMRPEQAASLAQGLRLRAYAFDRYKTKRKEDEKSPKVRNVTIAVGDIAAVRTAFNPRSAITDGVLLARDLVNEPANVLYPEEFARRTLALKKLRVAVEVLDVRAMKKLGMNALIGVGQGSSHQSRVVVMRWNGGRAGEAPVAFIGKGVCFDTGGISIKPAASMEDMSLLDRFPILVWAGAALLGWIVGEVIATDPVVVGWLTAKYGAAVAHQVEIAAAVVGAVLVLVVGGAWRRSKVQAESKA